MHAGAFVWADSTDEGFASEREDQFRVRANGGAAFQVGALKFLEIRAAGNRFVDTSTNAYLSLGGTWTNASDRELKENIELVDPQEVLQQLTTLPIYTWNYEAEGSEIQHMGPMADDFHATFAVGYDESSIATIDAEGVALAAIKGLYETLEGQKAVIARQQAQIATLQQQLQDLQRRMAALEKSAD
jgi:hypothetical protein